MVKPNKTEQNPDKTKQNLIKPNKTCSGETGKLSCCKYWHIVS